jgi:hypothetical protein
VRVYVDHSGAPILRDVTPQIDRLDSFMLMLCHDGSHGLDLSFVTHLFLVNEIADPAIEQQVTATQDPSIPRGAYRILLI